MLTYCKHLDFESAPFFNNANLTVRHF